MIERYFAVGRASGASRDCAAAIGQNFCDILAPPHCANDIAVIDCRCLGHPPQGIVDDQGF